MPVLQFYARPISLEKCAHWSRCWVKKKKEYVESSLEQVFSEEMLQSSVSPKQAKEGFTGQLTLITWFGSWVSNKWRRASRENKYPSTYTFSCRAVTCLTNEQRWYWDIDCLQVINCVATSGAGLSSRGRHMIKVEFYQVQWWQVFWEYETLSENKQWQNITSKGREVTKL